MCIVGLSLGSSKNEEITDPETQVTSSMTFGLIAVVFGVISPLSFAFGGLTVRYFSENYNFDPFDMTITAYFISSTILIIAMLFTFEYGSHPFIVHEYFEIVASGVMAALGVVLLNLAITSGLAGPVFALANIQVIIQTALDAVIIGDVPTVIEIISALLGILGKHLFSSSFLF